MRVAPRGSMLSSEVPSSCWPNQRLQPPLPEAGPLGSSVRVSRLRSTRGRSPSHSTCQVVARGSSASGVVVAQPVTSRPPSSTRPALFIERFMVHPLFELARPSAAKDAAKGLVQRLVHGPVAGAVHFRVRAPLNPVLLPLGAAAEGLADGLAQAAHVLRLTGQFKARRCRPAIAQRVDPHVVANPQDAPLRSEEHTSELQSRGHLVCRL